MQDEIRTLLVKAVPAAPQPPSPDELLARFSRAHRRFMVRSAALVAGGAIAIALLVTSLAREGIFDRSAAVTSPSSQDESTHQSAAPPTTVNCPGRAAVMGGSDYAPLTFGSPERSLEHDLNRRHLKIEAKSFNRSYLAESLVRYWIQKGDRVLAVATAQRSNAGWMLAGLSVCAELHE